MPFKKRERSLREIGATLDVATLLEGSVRRAGSRVRIVAQLIDAETDRHLWAETYDRDLTDIFAIQTDVALQIAGALEAELSQEETDPDPPGAHRRRPGLPALPAGEALPDPVDPAKAWTRRSSTSSRPIARDPDYRAGLRHHRVRLHRDRDRGGRLAPVRTRHFGGRRPRWRRRSSSTLSSPEAHAVLAHLKVRLRLRLGRRPRRSSSGRSSSTRTAATPTTSTGCCCPPSNATTRRSRRSAGPRARPVGPPHGHRDHVPPGRPVRRGPARHDPGASRSSPTSPLAHAHAGMGLSADGEAGRRESPRCGRRCPSPLTARSTWRSSGRHSRRVGRTDEAREVLRQLEELSTRAVRLAVSHGVRLHRARRARAGDGLAGAGVRGAGRAAIFGVKGSFLFAPLRSHPRFQALLGKMNLSDGQLP